MPKGFEIDDVSISHDSEFLEEGENNEMLSGIIQNLMDQLVEKKMKVPDEDEDDV